MKFLRRTLAIASSAAIIAVLAACSTDTEPNTDPSGDTAAEPGGALAWSFASQDVNIWNAQLELMRPMVEEAGYEFLTDNPAFDLQAQVDNWTAWISRGDVKAIGGFPVDPASMTAVTTQATDAGIPIISYAVTWDGVTATTEISNYDAGHSVGLAAGEWILEGYGTESVSVAFLADTTTGLGQTQLEGMQAGLAESGATVVEYVLEATTRDTGYSQAQSQLIADPDTVVWLGIGADMVLGARQAVVDSGVDPGDEAYYVSATDADAEVLELIASGEDMWRTSFAWKATDLAEANVALLLAAAQGETPENILVGVSQVTADNVDEFALN